MGSINEVFPAIKVAMQSHDQIFFSNKIIKLEQIIGVTILFNILQIL